MKVEFEADYKDFAEISYLSWKQYSVSERVVPFLKLYLLIPLLCSFLVLIFVQENWWAFSLTLILVFLIVFFFYPFPTLGNYQDENFKTLGNKLFPIEIDFSEDGIRVKQLGNEFLWGWENIVSFLETNERLCFFTNDKIGISIPKRAIFSQNEKAELIAFARSRMSQEVSE